LTTAFLILKSHFSIVQYLPRKRYNDVEYNILTLYILLAADLPKILPYLIVVSTHKHARGKVHVGSSRLLYGYFLVLKSTKLYT